jgi:hypothetical protein
MNLLRIENASRLVEPQLRLIGQRLPKQFATAPQTLQDLEHGRHLRHPGSVS